MQEFSSSMKIFWNYNSSLGEVLCKETACETASASADHKPISKWLLDWYKQLANAQIDLTKHPDVDSKKSRSVKLKNNEL